MNCYLLPHQEVTACGEYTGATAVAVGCGRWSAVSCPDCLQKEPVLTPKDLSVNYTPMVIEQEVAHSNTVYAIEKASDEIVAMMVDRHKKYGPGNIAKHGPIGILVRMDDKFARLEAGQGNFDDETVENTLDDIIGYALIWKLWLRREWPGSEV